ncbi:radical SAM family heme chaperone HemW [Alteromonas oceanisediminis]|uniref:radical SAM family heme chaperone HemW n=1 Tax=Alteromonas oceanisediminis TaxID=2836180 RepID=UPI001BDAD3A4|nr:radical SAM family heme chaperone HemW [Alteromonas oceanisediminis]MBT0585096.1 radical SAM family heme chaperone HemW [Alteromonas oceanisediminis]
MLAPSLSLYVHIPWCVQKCPYCDFNSHTLKSGLPEKEYVAHLLDDLAVDAARVKGREVTSIFIGGGTPSLFSAGSIETLLRGIRERIALHAQAEITLEANPGTVESERFIGFKQAGVNRISMGVQSFQQQHLSALGRIHDSQQALNAAHYAKQAKLRSFNMDLMHGLPQQSVQNALDDLDNAIAQHPPHLSWYQLTLEPNTPFYSKPPALPDDDVLWEIQQSGHQRLTAAGYHQYEISGYAKLGHECQHNLNYWRFGDYLGIGCGAHGKITDTKTGSIHRTVKVKHPRGYMQLGRDYLDSATPVATDDLPFEFFMNRFRLTEPCPIESLEQLTGIAAASKQMSVIDKSLQSSIQKGLLTQTSSHWQVTALGRRYLNTLLEHFV